MKKILIILFYFATLFTLQAKNETIRGPQGALAYKISLPEGFDPDADPPEYIRCWGFMKLGRDYLLTTQQLDIYGTASAYKGSVRILHGTKDSIVPMWCSEKFKETYGDKAELTVIEGENHTITRRRAEVVRQVVEFFKR